VDGLIFRYLRGRPTLRRVCLLADARHGLMEVDRSSWTSSTMPPCPIRSSDQADKLAAELDRRHADVAKEIAGHVGAHPEIVVTSAHAGLGIPELRAHLAALAKPAAIQ
jgi:GTP-binding protein